MKKMDDRDIWKAIESASESPYYWVGDAVHGREWENQNPDAYAESRKFLKDLRNYFDGNPYDGVIAAVPLKTLVKLRKYKSRHGIFSWIPPIGEDPERVFGCDVERCEGDAYRFYSLESK